MFYVNLYFVYKIQIHVKTDILEIISRIQTNNAVVNYYFLCVTVGTSSASQNYQFPPVRFGDIDEDTQSNTVTDQ